MRLSKGPRKPCDCGMWDKFWGRCGHTTDTDTAPTTDDSGDESPALITVLWDEPWFQRWLTWMIIGSTMLSIATATFVILLHA